MATISFSRTISAGDVTRMSTALKAYFGMPANASNAAVQAEAEKAYFAWLVGIVKQYERDQAAKTAADAVTDISLT